MKQLIWSLAAVLVAAGILAGAVLYTVSAIRTAQLQILTGENIMHTQSKLCR